MRRVARGEPLRIQSDVWNDMTDVVNWWRRNMTRETAERVGQTRTVLARNTDVSQDTIERFSVVALNQNTQTLLDDPDVRDRPGMETPVYEIQYVEDAATDRIAITLEPLPHNEYGEIVIVGWAPVWVESDFTVDARYAVPVDGETYMRRVHQDGYELVRGPIPGTVAAEGRWEIVNLNQFRTRKPLIRFTLTSSLAGQATATCTINEQMGNGIEALITAPIVRNFQRSVAGNPYLWNNPVGHRGLAEYAEGDEYQIILMEPFDPDCSGQCEWTGEAHGWVLSDDPCTAGCDCEEPETEAEIAATEFTPCEEQ